MIARDGLITGSHPDSDVGGEAREATDNSGRERLTVGILESRGGAPLSTLATESGHWYLPDGTPFYTYVNDDGETKPVTLREARKVNAFPSTTTVGKILEKPALNNYSEKHVFEATLRLLTEEVNLGVKAILDDENLRAEFFARVKVAANEHRDKAANRGSSLHGEIERYLRGEKLYEPERWWPHVDELVKALAQYGVDVHKGSPEKCFAHRLGYGGKVDWHERTDPLVIDIKTKPEIELNSKGNPKKKLVYDEHFMQIASYRTGLAMPNARGINVFVGEADRRIWIHEHTPSDLNRGWKLFELLLRVWKIKNNYYPKINQ